MKKSLFALAAVLSASTAYALADSGAAAPVGPKTFALCIGRHHGSDYEFQINPKGQVVINRQTDADEDLNEFRIASIAQYGKAISSKGRAQAIRQAIRAAAANDPSYGEVVIQAVNAKGQTFTLDLNNPSGAEIDREGEKFEVSHFSISGGGSVQVLNCPVSSIVE